MRAKPEMKPWGHAYEKEDELRRSGTNSTSAGALALGVSAAPLGLKIWIHNPGLAPRAMNKYRPFRAHLREYLVLIAVSTSYLFS